MPAKRIDSEADLIRDYFAPLSAAAPLAFGLTDDAAIIRPPDGMDVIVSTDPVREGVHFFLSDAAGDVAWKAIAVNISDVVAKGGRPFAYTMALGLPDAPTEAWARGFAAGLAEAQAAFGCHLIGGDTDRVAGPLSVAITMFAAVPRGRMVPRHGARPGDAVFVSGTIGDAALGLALRQQTRWATAVALAGEAERHVLNRYLRPRPRLALAPELVSHARSALDISDGFIADLGKLVGDHAIDVALDSIPLSEAARAVLVTAGAPARQAILAGGGDYEVLAAVPADNAEAFASAAAQAGVAVTRIGSVRTRTKARAVARGGVVVIDGDGLPVDIAQAGYDHLTP